MPWECKKCGCTAIWGNLMSVFVGDDKHAGGSYVDGDTEYVSFYCEECGTKDECIEDIADWSEEDE